MSAPWRSWIQEVRERLESPPPRRLPAHDRRPAAVLVPLYVEAGELWTILTRRAEDLPHHRSQIAFPGGGREVGEDPWAAALRESAEEIGLDPRRVLRLGELDEVATPTGFGIVPCVAAVPTPVATRANPAEIAEIFAAPLPALASPQLVEEREVRLDGQRRRLRIYHFGKRQIWGVTAQILHNLLLRLGLQGEEEA